jgi:hypothetical protein
MIVFATIVDAAGHVSSKDVLDFPHSVRSAGAAQIGAIDRFGLPTRGGSLAA